MKKFWKSVNIWQRYGQNFVAYFFGPPCRLLHNTILRWHQRCKRIVISSPSWYDFYGNVYELWQPNLPRQFKIQGTCISFVCTCFWYASTSFDLIVFQIWHQTSFNTSVNYCQSDSQSVSQSVYLFICSENVQLNKTVQQLEQVKFVPWVCKT